MQKSLIEEIQACEQVSRLLDPDQAVRTNWNNQAYHYAENFLRELPIRKAFQHERKPDDKDFAPLFDEPVAMEALLSQLEAQVDNSGIDTASNRYLGFIPGGGLYPSAIADYIAALTNRYSGVFFASPGAIRIENQIIRWMADLLGLPATASGNLTSGGSMANLIALVTAREAHQLKAIDYHRSVIYLTKNTHTSAQKSLRVAGMVDVIKRYIPVDENYCMNIASLRAAILEDVACGLKPWLIYASAGTTDTGSIDALDEMATLAKAHALWLHVDAAYGGFFALTEAGKKLFKGIEKVDSLTLDPHKALFLPYGIGAVLIRHHHVHRSAFTEYAPCLQDCINATEELSPCDLSPELTRHFRALRIWLPLKLFGLEPFRAALQEKLLLTEYFYQHLKEIKQIQIACPPQLSIVTFRYLPEKGDINAINAGLIKTINEDGRIYLSSTSLNGNFYLRMACLSFRTHLTDIQLALSVIQEKITQLI
ncbi:MAG: pyridoxal phosphate-dependent decarboxylase family protein [Gammaproteobacteria bacterium]